MERSEIKPVTGRLPAAMRKLGVATAALALFLPLQAAAQVYTCDSHVEMDADGAEPFFINEEIPIIITLEAETVSDGTQDGVLNINSFDYKSDCEAGTDFNTCTPAGNTVVIVTPDDQIGGTCGASFTTSPGANPDTTTVFTPASPIELAPTESCTVEFKIMVVQAPSGTPSIIESSGWAESQVACFTADGAAFPPAASSSASAQLSFQLSTERTEFIVTKFFSDQSQTETANMNIQCNGGLPLSNSYTLNHLGRVRFVVKEFIPGRLDCTVWEDPKPGYTPVYKAASLGGAATGVSADANGCHFTGVSTGLFSCDVTNNIDSVEIKINKSWGAEFENGPVPLVADAHYICYDVYTSPDGAGGVTNVEGDITFNGLFDSYVITGVYPSSTDSYCTVTEVTPPEDWIDSDDTDCARVPVVSGAECTIYNSAAFEGIPTLNTYGMALLALLMLGVGAVGFRRFA